MTRPTARVLALLEILQNGGIRTAADLAARLGVDERTVRRYVDHLLDLEVPVESVRGPHGGFRLAPGFRMPPLMLTAEEALAVLLSLITSRGAAQVATSPEVAESAAAKVRRILPKALASRLGAVLESTTFTATGREPDLPEISVLLRLAEAARQRHPAVISYTDRAGRRSERTLEPYGIVAHAGRWYVTGPDSSSGETRTFRLDRIARVHVLEGTFAVPEGYVPADQVMADLAGTPWRHRVEVLVLGAADEVCRRLPPGIATVEPHTATSDGTDTDDDTAGWVRVRLRAEQLDWVPGLLGGLSLPFVVQEPAELRDLVRAWAQRLAGCGGATSPQEALAVWRAPASGDQRRTMAAPQSRSASPTGIG